MEEIDGNVIRPGSVKDKVEIKGVETGKESREEETHVSVCHWGEIREGGRLESASLHPLFFVPNFLSP